MKHLAILTDFSVAARNAADLAMRLAAPLKLNILLVTADSGKIDNKDTTTDTAEILQNEISRMQHRADFIATDDFKPVVSTAAFSGSFDDLVNVFSITDLELVLMGADTNAKGFAASKVQEVSEALKLPVLFVPANYEDEDIKTICFVTDLTEKDINTAAYLMQNAAALNAGLFVGHISKPSFNIDADEEMQIAAFMSGLEKLGFHNHQYQNVYSEDVAQGIELFCHNKRADMLVLVNRKHSGFWELFNRSVTDVLKTHQHLPILLMPDPAL